MCDSLSNPPQTIQPVVNKETIQPSVVHTTVPIHEVHQNEAKHHAASALPAVSMADFKKQGGSLTGREERYDGFEGEPRAVGSLGGQSSGLESKMDRHADSDMDGSRGMGRSGAGTTGGYGSGPAGDSYDTAGTTGTKKPSMMDKLNPMKDSDGDGRKGIGK